MAYSPTVRKIFLSAALGAALIMAIAAIATLDAGDNQGDAGRSAVTLAGSAASIGGGHANILDSDIDGAASHLEGWLFAAAHRSGSPLCKQGHPCSAPVIASKHAAHLTHINHHKAGRTRGMGREKSGRETHERLNEPAANTAAGSPLPARKTSLDSQASTVLHWLGLSHLRHGHHRPAQTQKQVT